MQIKKLFLHPTSHPYVQLFRYGIVVAIAFPIDFGLLYIFTSKLHMYYVLSASLAFLISMIVNYLISVMWVFRERTTTNSKVKDPVVFGIIGFVGLGLTDLFIWILTTGFGLYYLVSKLLAAIIVFFWSFGARRYMFHGTLLN